MANACKDESYYDSIIDYIYNLLEYEIHEPGKSDYIDNLIAMSSTKFTQPTIREAVER